MGAKLHRSKGKQPRSQSKAPKSFRCDVGIPIPQGLGTVKCERWCGDGNNQEVGLEAAIL